jgi:tetratricopeptide (TPR) repeat protein
MPSDAIKPFTRNVPEADLEDLRRRLRAARFPEAETVDGWGQGVPLEALRLCDLQLLVASDAVPVLLARAEARLMLGQHKEAVRDLERALTLAPSSEVASDIAQRLQKLGTPHRTLH